MRFALEPRRFVRSWARIVAAQLWPVLPNESTAQPCRPPAAPDDRQRRVGRLPGSCYAAAGFVSLGRSGSFIDSSCRETARQTAPASDVVPTRPSRVPGRSRAPQPGLSSPWPWPWALRLRPRPARSVEPVFTVLSVTVKPETDPAGACARHATAVVRAKGRLRADQSQRDRVQETHRVQLRETAPAQPQDPAQSRADRDGQARPLHWVPRRPVRRLTPGRPDQHVPA